VPERVGQELQIRWSMGPRQFDQRGCSRVLSEEGEIISIKILGSADAQKTAFVEALSSGRYEARMVATIGVDYKNKCLDGTRFQLWDSAGQESFRSLTAAVPRDAVFMISCLQSTLDALCQYRDAQHQYPGHLVLLVDYSFLGQEESDAREVGDFSMQSPAELAEIAQANEFKIIQCGDFAGPEEFLLHIRELSRLPRAETSVQPRVEPPRRRGSGCCVM
jgi:hypothetical protein